MTTTGLEPDTGVPAGQVDLDQYRHGEEQEDALPLAIDERDIEDSSWGYLEITRRRRWLRHEDPNVGALRPSFSSPAATHGKLLSWAMVGERKIRP